MLGVLSPVIQRQSLPPCSWESLEAVDDCLVRFSSALSGEFSNQDEPAFALGQCI